MNKLQTQFDVSSLLLSDNSIHFDVHGLFDVKYAGNETLKDKTINLKLEISSLYEKFWIIMDLDFDFKSECSRCLDGNNINKQSTLKLDFYKNQENDYEIDFNSAKIDLSPVISEAILNEMKIQYICKSSCKGLCSDCGKNQNLFECKHPKKNIKESPFSSLSELDL